MSEHEKNVLEVITKAIPTLNEFSKGYVSGYLAAKEEAGAANKKKENEAEETKTAELKS